MVFFYVSMAFSVRMTPKHAKYGIFILLYTLLIIQSTYLRINAIDPIAYVWKIDKFRKITPLVPFFQGCRKI